MNLLSRVSLFLSGWKLIKVAPKDGVHIWCYDSEGGQYVASFVRYAKWYIEKNKPEEEGNFSHSETIGGGLFPMRPTHWRSLPKPPPAK